MTPTDDIINPTVQDLMRDLLQRAEAAEARADTETQRADTETQRANIELKKVEVVEAKNRNLHQKLLAQDALLTALMDQVASLTRRLAQARSKPEQLLLELELKAVQRRLNDLNRDRFGETSERRGRPEEAPKKEKPERKKQTGHGPTPQPELPRVPQLHLIEEKERGCAVCDDDTQMLPLNGMSEDTEQVDVIERTFRILMHKCQVYGCPICGYKEVAKGPQRLIKGGRYSVEFAATVATDKYAMALPLARQVRRMREQGLRVTSQTLWDQTVALYRLLLPAYLLLQEQILSCDVVYVDETSWRLMGKGKSKRWWAWVITDGRRVFFQITSNRATASARQILGDYAGILMADRYAVYESLEKERTRKGGQQVILPLDGEAGPPKLAPTPDYDLVACWMHARRGFVKASRHGEEAAEHALDLIGELYAVEDRAREQVKHIEDRAEREAALIVVRGPMRESVSRGLIARLREWLDGVLALPDLPLSKAIQWVNNGWVQLIRFLEDPRIPLDNGEAERTIRGLAVGRKNYAGSRSELGTRVAGLFYSLVESCRKEGVSPRAYLVEAAGRALLDKKSTFQPADFAQWLSEQPPMGHAVED